MDLDLSGQEQQDAKAASSESAPQAAPKELKSHLISILVSLPGFASGQDPSLGHPWAYLGLLMSWAKMGPMDL